VIATILSLGVVGGAEAGAAIRAELDRGEELRFLLKGKTLKLTVVDRPNLIQSPTIQSELFGKRLRFGCGTSFRPARRTTVFEQARWPVATKSFSVRFDRDLSRRVKWCLVEAGVGEFAGGDIAFVSFRDPEPGRRLARGELPDGTPWRLAAWRGEMLEPCLSLRTSGGSSQMCFAEMSDVDAGVGAYSIVPACSSAAMVFGAAARSAVRVEVSVADAPAIEAELRSRPRGSSVRAQYFFATFASPVDVVSVMSYGADGRVLARDRGVSGSRPSCSKDLRR